MLELLRPGAWDLSPRPAATFPGATAHLMEFIDQETINNQPGGSNPSVGMKPMARSGHDSRHSEE